VNKQQKVLNHVMKVFTLLSIMFLPELALGGLWGMNVTVPMQGSTSLAPWFSIVGFCLTVNLLVVFIFNYKKM
jgi:Mg2+ and Co2+ transporter CorA